MSHNQRQEGSAQLVLSALCDDIPICSFLCEAKFRRCATCKRETELHVQGAMQKQVLNFLAMLPTKTFNGCLPFSLNFPYLITGHYIQFRK